MSIRINSNMNFLSTYFNSNYYSSNSRSNSLYSSGLSSSSIFSNPSILSDFSTIKSGAYTKLLRAYYDKVGSSSNNSSSINSDKSTALESNELSKSAQALSSLEYTEANMDDIYKKVSSFVEDYNSLITTADDSTIDKVLQNTVWLTSSTKAYSGLLSKAGITVKEDNTLSINETDFKNAKLSTVSSLFSGSNSYASQVSSRADKIYNLSLSGGVFSTSYSNTGRYNTLSVSSMFDTLL